jgi:hypothetical protein
MSNKLDHYLIHYHDKYDTSLYWRCQAENYEHAIEQLEDFERTSSGGVIFHELIEG